MRKFGRDLMVTADSHLLAYVVITTTIPIMAHGGGEASITGGGETTCASSDVT
ncbi:hypothetical protein ACH4UY_37915 [Streptomyces longwoodensis]|uniref:hypothetical protein n=1 Tax=Streptomyces longwoodensis TaxID=68231 RepID=UPI0037B6DCE0